MRTALRGYVSMDCFDIKIKKDPPKKVNFFSEEQQAKLLKTAKDMGQIYYLVVLLCVSLGIRIGELAGLKWSDFDFEKKTVHIQRTCQRVKNYSNDPNKKGKTEVIFTTPKSKTSDRFIPLPDFLIDILNSIPHDTEFVISQNGKFVEPRTIQNWWKKLLK
jgi:integrase